MELVPAGIALSFESTFNDPTLSVALVAYDTTGVTPVLIAGPTEMDLVYGNTYSGKFTPLAGRSYVIVKSVYTDGTFTVLDPTFSAGSESIFAENIPTTTGSTAGNNVVGIVDTPSPDGVLPVFVVFTGDHKTLSMRAFYADYGGPLDLTGASEIALTLTNADGSFTVLLFSLGQISIDGPAILGLFSANISSIVSAALNIGELQNFDVTFTIGGKTFTVRYYQSISVFQSEP